MREFQTSEIVKVWMVPTGMLSPNPSGLEYFEREVDARDRARQVKLPWSEVSYDYPWETCGSCGVVDKEVEAAGIYHCPIEVCHSAGAAYHREKWDSYKVVEGGPGGRHTIDPKEAVDRCNKLLQGTLPNRHRAAVMRMLQFWKGY